MTCFRRLSTVNNQHSSLELFRFIFPHRAISNIATALDRDTSESSNSMEAAPASKPEQEKATMVEEHTLLHQITATTESDPEGQVETRVEEDCFGNE